MVANAASGAPRQGPLLPGMLFSGTLFAELFPVWQPLNLGRRQILMPLIVLIGLGFSWFLLQRLVPGQRQKLAHWLPARRLLLTWAVLLLWLL